VFGFWFFVEHWQKGHPSPSANAAASMPPLIYILKNQNPNTRHQSRHQPQNELAVLFKQEFSDDVN